MDEMKDPSIPARASWIAQMLRDVGFPVFVALYLLLGLAPKIDTLNAAVQRLIDIEQYQVIRQEEKR